MKKRRISPEETRQRLIDAGLRLFGIKGLEATRTRELAEMAGVNQAAIPYHFGGKEGLYLAVAQDVVRRGGEDLKERLDEMQVAFMSGTVDRDKAAVLLNRLLCTFVDNIIMSSDISDRSRFVLREYSSPGAAFDIIYEGFLEKMHIAVSRLVAILVDEPPDSERVVIRAHSVMGTVVSMVIARNLLLRRLGWDSFKAEKMDTIKLIISEFVANGLDYDISEQHPEAS